MPLALRAAIAVFLMIGFYFMAVAIAAGLLAIPVMEVVFANQIHPKLAILCVIGGLAVLWSILPRFDRFVAPGPQLTAEEHPRLFKMIEDVAREAGQPVPHEVYLVMEVNAWVMHRGGIMGFGSRPVMGLGLPLMQALNEEELKAVIAHEFGHYHAGDTKLGPWIYKTRAAIGRTLQTLSESILQAPFIAYGNFFLRTTHAISRAQEFCADAVAARIVGARHVISGLRRVHGASIAFDSYWKNEVSPVLGAGYRPPLAHGFSRFMGAQNIGEAVEKAVSEEMTSKEKKNPYDTHPPLRERVKAVEGLNPGSEASGRLAIELLDHVEDLERRLLVFLSSDAEIRKLKTVEWESVAETVYIPRWKKLVDANAKWIAGATPESIFPILADLKGTLKVLRMSDGDKPTLQQVAPLSCSIFSIALTLRLVELGGVLLCPPGEPVRVKYNGVEHETFKLFAKGMEDKPDIAGLKADLEASGLKDIVLQPAA